MPTTFFLIIINITYSFFDTLGIIDTTTIGAPSGETKTLVYKAYIDGFKGLDLGSAGAQSIIMMLIVLVITVFQFRFIEGKFITTNMSRIFRTTVSHSILIWGVLLMIVPLWLVFASSTHTNSFIYNEGMQWKIGGEFFENYDRVLNRKGGFTKEITASGIFYNSFIMAFGIASLSVFVSMMAAYSLVYFKTRFSTLFFWLIFITLLVPLELRILPSYQIVSDLNLLNSYAGLILPLSASAIATFFFRQYYRSIPEELWKLQN